MGPAMKLDLVALRIVELVNLAALLGLVLVALGFLILPVLYFAQRRPADGASPPLELTGELPRILVQLPIFNEPHLVRGLLASVTALDWPRDKLHIQLLDDSCDETRDVARGETERLRASGFHIEHLQREHRAGFKAQALDAGLSRCDAPFVALLDADFRPPPQWLRVALPRLLAEPKAGFVQSRCEFANANENWLTRAQGLLFDAHFLMEHAVRASAGLPIQFNGTGAVWRRSAIEAAGGWSSDSLSEDLSLTLRAALAGWRGLFAADPPIEGLVPHQLSHWRVQQRRWSMGFAQNARAWTAKIWTSDLPLAGRLSTAFMLLYQLVALPLVVVGIVAGLIEFAFGYPDRLLVAAIWVSVVLLAPILAVALTLPPYLELRRGGLCRYLGSLAAIPPLVVYLSFANAAAIASGLFGGGDQFHRTPKSHWRADEPQTQAAMSDRAI
jgi:cellulose synthase/poly-beta-1,6-N-acetylglucosamine synthase-like glycosyltransferase